MSRNFDAFAAATAACKQRGFAVARLEFPSSTELLTFAQLVGHPSVRDAGKAMWCVSPTGSSGTFSTSTGPADLHTDSTYHHLVEPFVLLYVERPAAHGGESLVLHVDDLVSELDDGEPDTMALLHAPIWKWRRPEALGGGDTAGYPVLDDGGVRWRRDTLVINGESDAQRNAAGRVTATTADSRAVRSLHLDRGDALLIDNRCVLHGRTGFTDPARRLHRIRFWELHT